MFLALPKIVIQKHRQKNCRDGKTAKTLEREQANNIKDIVKYETGVTVVEAGRFGQSGFAIRGVDENRVAINIDGLRQLKPYLLKALKSF